MTIGELRKIFEEKPIMVDIVAEYLEAEKNNPEGLRQATPLILKVIQDMKKAREGESWQ